MTDSSDAAAPASPGQRVRVVDCRDAHALSEAGRYGEALALVAGELSRHPDDGELLFARASILFDWGRIREACTGFLQAEAAGLDRTALYLNLAWSCQLLGLPETRGTLRTQGDRTRPGQCRRAFRTRHDPAAAEALSRTRSPFSSTCSKSRRTTRRPPRVLRAASSSQRNMPRAEAWYRRAVDARAGESAVPDQSGRRHRQSGTVRRVARGAQASRRSGVGARRATAEHDRHGLRARHRPGRYHEALDIFRTNLPRPPGPARAWLLRVSAARTGAVARRMGAVRIPLDAGAAVSPSGRISRSRDGRDRTCAERRSC